MAQVFCPKCEEWFSTNRGETEGWFVTDDSVDKIEDSVRRFFGEKTEGGRLVDHSPILDGIIKFTTPGDRCPYCGLVVLKEGEEGERILPFDECYFCQSPTLEEKIDTLTTPSLGYAGTTSRCVFECGAVVTHDGDGNGKIVTPCPKDVTKPCPSCNGTGKAGFTLRAPIGEKPVEPDCLRCDGSGKAQNDDLETEPEPKGEMYLTRAGFAELARRGLVRCYACESWKKQGHWCENPKLNLGSDGEGEDGIGHGEFPYQCWQTGPDFGCIHFKPKATEETDGGATEPQD